jgi:hypothetical protein
MQYKRGMSPDGPWQMEPHADFLAGWAIGRNGAEVRDLEKEAYLKELENPVQAFFDLGDYAFNDPTHHGEPKFRAAMVRAGYASRRLDISTAFELGKKFAGLT